MTRIQRWLRRINLDRLQASDADCVLELAHDSESMTQFGRREVDRLLRLILLQALGDSAIGIHLFEDTEDGCMRMLYCLPVSPEGDTCAAAQAKTEWYEMIPPPHFIQEVLFGHLRRRAGMRPDDTTGTLVLWRGGREFTADVIVRWPNDYRIFFGPERPPIRPKLARQFAEVGRPVT